MLASLNPPALPSATYSSTTTLEEVAVAAVATATAPLPRGAMT